MSKRKIFPLSMNRGLYLIACNEDEIRIILRGADDVVGRGGRNLLSLILKGSKSQIITKYNLSSSVSYGAFAAFTLEVILGKIDWVIRNDYLMIDTRMPVIIFAPKGWEIFKLIYAHELLSLLYEGVQSDIVIERFLETNREIKFLLIFLIQENFDQCWLPLLKQWKNAETKKIREAIESIFE